ncbi:DUF1654 domain-containing protein [Pseudomonas tremae]|uniref:DUF1654 domain-containing protein n=1 Tax=Pseudomonas syringae group TaxID=136849 RepID=UPI0001AF457B|nr:MULTISPECIES: DUF1654 domain-containing protein [Pseudomonas syringae group]MCQ3014851.1 DUF1654 domain-containing protein [Pseudomonas tremae]QGL56620.1 DUF1654 domain-containing protein [Pseudomonas coronafaciens pv. oryzae str. 1_6]
MAKKQPRTAVQEAIAGVERLGLRVSGMINHPTAQQRRSVTIHRLDTDGDLEWGEVLSVLSETDTVDVTINDDGSVTLDWGALDDDDPTVQVVDELEVVNECR